jgi:hypothetical protein
MAGRIRYRHSRSSPQMNASAGAQGAGGAFGEGSAPVPVKLPVEGVPVRFDKLLVLDEELTIAFDYRGLKD